MYVRPCATPCYSASYIARKSGTTRAYESPSLAITGQNAAGIRANTRIGWITQGIGRWGMTREGNKTVLTGPGLRRCIFSLARTSISHTGKPLPPSHPTPEHGLSEAGPYHLATGVCTLYSASVFSQTGLVNALTSQVEWENIGGEVLCRSA